MNIIIPLGGKGERFSKENYKQPKPLIQIFEKKMIEYVLDNLNYSENDKVFIIYNNKLDEHHFNDFVKSKYKLDTYPIDDTKGAVETLYKGITEILKTNDYHEKTILLDCDTFYTEDIISKFRDSDDNICFYTNNTDIQPIYSYIQLNNDNIIIDIKEKEKISDNANTGCYAFNNIHQLYNYSKDVLDNNITFNNEPYTSCVISNMISNKHVFKGIEINKKNYFSLGTPNQVNTYINNTHAFLLDLDGTLVLTDDIYFNVWKKILIRYNIKITDEIFRKYIQGNNDQHINNTLLKSIDVETKVISMLKDKLFIENISKIKLIDGVINFLKHVKMNGHKISIVTNCNKNVAYEITKYTGIINYIDFIISASDVKNGKPNPEPYLTAMERYNINSSKCFIFEDSKSGILSGKQSNPKALVGIETIYNSDELQKYNVDFSLKNYLNFNIELLFSNKATYLQELKKQISKTLNISNENISFSSMLKGGFIADVNAFYVNNNGVQRDYIIKYENNDNDLSIMAKKMELYEREYYFYQHVSHDVNIKIPEFISLIKNDNYNGIILENLYSKNYVPNLNLSNESIDVSLKIIEQMATMHSKFWNRNTQILYPKLKKTDDNTFKPFYNEFISGKYSSFSKKWECVLNKKQLNISLNIKNNFQNIQDRLASGNNLTLIHGDIKSPNIFYDIENNYHPYFMDWQHCGIGKGVQDLVFFIIESFNIEDLEPIYKLFTHYYFVKLKEYNINYSYSEYQKDLYDALCYVPYFTCLWFGTIPQDDLIDKNFPYFFITKLFYLLELLS